MSRLFLNLQKIRICMARMKLDNTLLAKRMGWSSQGATNLFGRIEQRKGTSPRLAGQLADALGVDITEILDENQNQGDDEKAA